MPENKWGISALLTQRPVPVPSQSDDGDSAIKSHLAHDGKVVIVIGHSDAPLFADTDEWMGRVEALSTLSCLPEQKLLIVERAPEDGERIRELHKDLCMTWGLAGGVPLLCDCGEIQVFVQKIHENLDKFSESFARRWQMLAEELGAKVIEKK